MADESDPTPAQPDGEISEELKVHVDTDQLHEWDKVRDDYTLDSDAETHRPAIAEESATPPEDEVEASEAQDPDAGSAGD
ncbi:hypothetical protein [Luteipulveratus halotolerans]|uniref:Uncharacterized protein n=1 Tax=Luteipulveratus halotolerans TaxID=1631356 RepID=A0A0L6CJE4_9MICO|nr:hypothetical protein [Luteipulveratus halotolerans]KNX37730.1 hypothetical protein VV01_12175 [Luteipulveratus halotolerans]